MCRKGTGHAETVKVVYDPDEVSLPFLLEQYYAVIDPLSVNRQGNDSGVQYRTGIYYTDEKDKPVIEMSLKRLQQHFKQPLTIEVQPLKQFSRAEEYHQDYLNKTPTATATFRPSASRKPDRPGKLNPSIKRNRMKNCGNP